MVFAGRGWDTPWETGRAPFFHLLPPAHVGLSHPVSESGRLRSDGFAMRANVGSYRSQGARDIVSSQCGREEESSDPGEKNHPKLVASQNVHLSSLIRKMMLRE